MLNQHLAAADSSLNQAKRAKRSLDDFNEADCEVYKLRTETAPDTPGSPYQEGSASLGKRSDSVSSELKLCGRKKDICTFLDSLNELEHMLDRLDSKRSIEGSMVGSVIDENNSKTVQTTQDKLHTLFSVIDQIEGLAFIKTSLL